MSMTLPGWDSIEAAARWHRTFEIAGFVALGLLLLFEVIAYIYGNRKDLLVAAAEQTVTEERRRQDEQANQQRNADIAEANRRATEAGARAQKLEQERAPRRIPPEQRETIVRAITPFAGQNVRLLIQQGEETHNFGQDIIAMFTAAHWNITGVIEGMIAINGPSNGVGVYTNRQMPARATALIGAFKAVGFKVISVAEDDADDVVIVAVMPK